MLKISLPFFSKRRSNGRWYGNMQLMYSTLVMLRILQMLIVVTHSHAASDRRRIACLVDVLGHNCFVTSVCPHAQIYRPCVDAVRLTDCVIDCVVDWPLELYRLSFWVLWTDNHLGKHCHLHSNKHPPWSEQDTVAVVVEEMLSHLKMKFQIIWKLTVVQLINLWKTKTKNNDSETHLSASTVFEQDQNTQSLYVCFHFC